MIKQLKNLFTINKITLLLVVIVSVYVMIEFYKQLHQGKLSLEDTLQIKNEFKSIVDGTMYKLSEFDDSDKNTYNKLGQYYSINNLIYEMITISSNFATNILIDYIGANNVTKSMKENRSFKYRYSSRC